MPKPNNAPAEILRRKRQALFWKQMLMRWPPEYRQEQLTLLHGSLLEICTELIPLNVPVDDQGAAYRAVMAMVRYVGELAIAPVAMPHKAKQVLVSDIPPSQQSA